MKNELTTTKASKAAVTEPISEGKMKEFTCCTHSVQVKAL